MLLFVLSYRVRRSTAQRARVSRCSTLSSCIWVVWVDSAVSPSSSKGVISTQPMRWRRSSSASREALSPASRMRFISTMAMLHDPLCDHLDCLRQRLAGLLKLGLTLGF